MKKLKDISKKQWGLISTSIGSILIFIGLLAMVGIGSGDTYAATTCSCSSYGTEYKLSGTTCTKTTTTTGVTCCTGLCSASGVSTCPSSATGCSTITNTGTFQIKSCTVTTTETKNAVCTTTSDTCGPGEYQVGSSYQGFSCLPCTEGNYCPNGVRVPCPANATCGAGASTFTCNSGYHKNGNTCVKNSGITCPAGYYYLDSIKNCSECEAGYYCPGGTADMSLLRDQLIISCPTNATCTASTFTCNSGYKQSGGTCVKTTSGGDSGNSGGNSGNSGGNSGNSGGEPCYTAAFQVDGSVVNTITGKRNADDGGCEVTAPSYTCSSGSFKGWFTNPTVCNQDVSGTGAGNILTLNSNKTYYGCCYKKSGDSGNSGGDSGNSGGNSGNSGGGNSGNSGGNSGNSGGGDSGNSAGGLGNADGGNNSSNVNNNPSTATKAPLVIALMGVVSLAFGVFTYWKNRKVTDM